MLDAVLLMARWCVADQQIVIGALLPSVDTTVGHLHSLHHMLQSVAAVFEEDINQVESILPGKQVKLLTARSGYAQPHLALSAVTKLYRESPKEATLIGWVGPFNKAACPPTQDLIHGLGQLQISFGCSSAALSNKDRFPVRAFSWPGTRCLIARLWLGAHVWC